MHLDHIAIVASAPDCARLLSFFVDIAGLTEGQRPPFGSVGHWLYLDGRAVLHLIQRPLSEPVNDHDVPRPCARIDHLALRVEHAGQWQALLARLREHRMPYLLSGHRAQQEQQLFVTPVPDVTVEFVIEARYLV
ncbi:extradiol dioxygenase [Herbaspirillum sp. NPDC087042]|uniref:extradiol dioxygenase n=1 Tax=Herbaspirillum sp. NPDC087042 TaxID=3364004 RepID=UPI0038069FB1